MDDFQSELIDFGCVYWGSKLTRSLIIKNRSTIDQTYVVENYSERPKLDSGFSVKPSKSPSIRPNEEFTFTVEFVPRTVNNRICDSFLIKHLYGVDCIVVARAVVKGPVCSISCSRLQMVCPNNKKKVSKQFTLKNEGQCDADFQFTVQRHPLVSVQPNHGRISPSASVRVTIAYTPVNNREYFKRVFCLVCNHEPLVIDVYASWAKSNENLTPKIENDFTPYLDGYHCFFDDVMTLISKDRVPVVSLDKRYIDFGHCQPKSSKQIEFSVTNSSDQRITILWCQGLFTKEFRIQPVEAELKANDCKTFSVTFKPLVRDQLFGTVLEAQVLLDEAVMPTPVEISLKGDSFEDLSCGWSAQYKVQPSSLVLPPCIPSPFYPSHATLTILRKGHLPLAFCFHPPPSTNFCVKPLQGVIQDSFQIVVVQYQPEKLYEAIDTEKWLLTFNSNENVNECFVTLGGSIEVPQVIINQDKDIEFPPVHPGTEFTLQANIYNPTRFSFWFDAEVVGAGSQVLEVDSPGELWPHEQRKLSLVFRPRGLGCLETSISCRPILGVEVTGKVTSTAVTAICCKTCLTVNPDKLMLIKVIRDFKHKRAIEVTNSGDAAIKGSFAWEPDDSASVDDFEISFLPNEFDLKPGDSLDVEVTITPVTTGEKSLFVKYVTSSSTHAAVLLPVSVSCVFPTLQITDLRTINSAPLFTKLHYWRLMGINKFNTVLLNLRPKETTEVYMDVPSFLSSSKPVTVELLVENSSELATRLDTRTLVSCDCLPVKRQVSFSVSRWDYDCPHRYQAALEPASVDVKAESFAVLKLIISYATEGDVESHFQLQLTPEDYEELSCSVKLRVRRTSIPKHSSYIDTTEPRENGDLVFNMRPVYIGDISPVAQGFMLYNNSKLYTTFEVDDGELRGSPFTYVGGKTSLSSMCNYNLMFTFQPYCCTTYEAQVVITMNNTSQKLILRGVGVDDPLEARDREFFPRVDKLNQNNPPEVFFSTSHIHIGPIQPKTTLNDVFFLNNNTEDMVSFKFLSAKTSEVVKIRVAPSRGLIPPGESVECRLSCCSCGYQCRIDTVLACALANYTQYTANIQSFNRFYEDVVNNENYFTITEKGMENPEVTPPLENWPVKIYLTMTVAVYVREASVNEGDTVPVCPVVVEPRLQVAEMREETKHVVTHVLERVLWDALAESFCPTQKTSDCSDFYYQQLKNHDMQTDVRVPNHMIQSILEDVLHSMWQDIFQLNKSLSSEILRRRLVRQTTPDSRPNKHSTTEVSISDSVSVLSEMLIKSKKSY